MMLTNRGGPSSGRSFPMVDDADTDPLIHQLPPFSRVFSSPLVLNNVCRPMQGGNFTRTEETNLLSSNTLYASSRARPASSGTTAPSTSNILTTTTASHDTSEFQPSSSSSSSQYQYTRHEAGGGSEPLEDQPTCSTSSVADVKPCKPLIYKKYRGPRRSKPGYVTVNGYSVPCLVIDGEPQLPMSACLKRIFRVYIEDEIRSLFDDLQVVLVPALEYEAELLKKLDDVCSRDANHNMYLVSRSDVERVLGMLRSESRPTPLDLMMKKDEKCIRISHHVYPKKVFGDLYPSRKGGRCICCTECKSWFTTEDFVSHTHSTEIEKGVVHWGFDPSNWRYLIRTDGVDRHDYYKEKAFQSFVKEKSTAPLQQEVLDMFQGQALRTGNEQDREYFLKVYKEGIISPAHKKRLREKALKEMEEVYRRTSKADFGLGPSFSISHRSGSLESGLALSPSSAGLPSTVSASASTSFDDTMCMAKPAGKENGNTNVKADVMDIGSSPLSEKSTDTKMEAQNLETDELLERVTSSLDRMSSRPLIKEEYCETTKEANEREGSKVDKTVNAQDPSRATRLNHQMNLAKNIYAELYDKEQLYAYRQVHQIIEKRNDLLKMLHAGGASSKNALKILNRVVAQPSQDQIESIFCPPPPLSSFNKPGSSTQSQAEKTYELITQMEATLKAQDERWGDVLHLLLASAKSQVEKVQQLESDYHSLYVSYNYARYLWQLIHDPTTPIPNLEKVPPPQVKTEPSESINESTNNQLNVQALPHFGDLCAQKQTSTPTKSTSLNLNPELSLCAGNIKADITTGEDGVPSKRRATLSNAEQICTLPVSICPIVTVAQALPASTSTTVQAIHQPPSSVCVRDSEGFVQPLLPQRAVTLTTSCVTRSKSPRLPISTNRSIATHVAHQSQSTPTFPIPFSMHGIPSQTLPTRIADDVNHRNLSQIQPVTSSMTLFQTETPSMSPLNIASSSMTPSHAGMNKTSDNSYLLPGLIATISQSSTQTESNPALYTSSSLFSQPEQPATISQRDLLALSLVSSVNQAATGSLLADNRGMDVMPEASQVPNMPSFAIPQNSTLESQLLARLSNEVKQQIPQLQTEEIVRQAVAKFIHDSQQPAEMIGPRLSTFPMPQSEGQVKSTENAPGQSGISQTYPDLLQHQHTFDRNQQLFQHAILQTQSQQQQQQQQQQQTTVQIQPTIRFPTSTVDPSTTQALPLLGENNSEEIYFKLANMMKSSGMLYPR